MPRQCGLFNIDTHDWTDIKNYNYNVIMPHASSFNFSVCHNNDDCVYVYDHTMNYTFKCDLNKNEWYTIAQDVKMKDEFGYDCMMIAFWYNDCILYGLSYPQWPGIGGGALAPPKLRYQLMSLDLRDKDRKWNVNRIDFEGLKKDGMIYYSFWR